jgi:uncharacterized protein
MSSRIACWLSTSALCLISACGSSPPLRYSPLREIAPDSRRTSAAQGVPVRVDRVTIPSELDRTQLVQRMDANRLQIAELDRWAAPLDEMIRRVLSIDLAARVSASQVGEPGDRQRSLSVDVLEFYGDAGCAVTLRAAWVLKQPHADTVRATEEVAVPAGGACPAALAATMSRALGQLSERIAARIPDSNRTSQAP